MKLTLLGVPCALVIEGLLDIEGAYLFFDGLIALGCFLFFVRWLRYGRHCLPPASLPLIGFFICYVLGILTSFPQQLRYEGINLAVLAICLFILPYLPPNCSQKSVERRLMVLLKVYAAMTTLLALGGLFLFAFEVHGVLVLGGILCPYGIIENRLWPFLNPNAAAIFAMFAIWVDFALILYEREKRGLRAMYLGVYGVQILLQMAIFVLTQSRGQTIAFMGMLMLFCAFVLPLPTKIRKPWRKILRLGFALISALALWFFMLLMSRALSGLPHLMMDQLLKSSLGGGAEAAGKLYPISDPAVGLQMDTISSALSMKSIPGHSSDARFNLWNIAWHFFVNYPVFGQSREAVHAQIMSTFSTGIQYSYIGSDFHNLFVSVLLYTGVVGSALFIGYLFWLLSKIFRYWRDVSGHYFEKCMLLFAPGFVISNLSETSRTLIGLWILMGFYYYWLQKAGLMRSSLFISQRTEALYMDLKSRGCSHLWRRRTAGNRAADKARVGKATVKHIKVNDLSGVRRDAPCDGK